MTCEAVSPLESPGISPIAIFIYRRPEKLRNMLCSLKQCIGFDQSPIMVFADGPRSDEDRTEVERARAVAIELLGDRAIYYLSDVNRGLAKSVMDGVAHVLRQFETVIVLEDDLVLHRGFLEFINRSLSAYINTDSVYQVSGYVPFVPEFSNQDSAVFLPFISSWGWATWRRAWSEFEPNALGWESLVTDSELRQQFDVQGRYGFSTMLVMQMVGQLDSWAIRWYWAVFRRSGLVLYPPTTLVQNDGMDGSGTHGRGMIRRAESMDRNSFNVFKMPITVEIREADLKNAARALWIINGSWLGFIGNSIRWLRISSIARRYIKKTSAHEMY